MFRELSRKNKQLSTEECILLLKEQTRGVLSVLGENGYPYGTPINHWYDPSDGCLYFHCGPAGHRLDALRRDNRASFCLYDQGFRRAGEWAWNVKSVVVFGRVDILDDLDTVVRVATQLSYKFTDDEDYIRGEIAQAAHHTRILRLTPEHIRGKLVTEA